MIVIAFAAFALLIVAWLAAPNGPRQTQAAVPAAKLAVSEARA